MYTHGPHTFPSPVAFIGIYTTYISIKVLNFLVSSDRKKMLCIVCLVSCIIKLQQVIYMYTKDDFFFPVVYLIQSLMVVGLCIYYKFSDVPPFTLLNAGICRLFPEECILCYIIVSFFNHLISNLMIFQNLVFLGNSSLLDRAKLFFLCGHITFKVIIYPVNETRFVSL